MINSIIKMIPFIVLAVMVGILFGTQFKKPNSELIKSSYTAKSEWRSTKIIEIARSKEPFFSFKKFVFNSFAGVVGGGFTFLIILFFWSKEFRFFLYRKIYFISEKENFKN